MANSVEGIFTGLATEFKPGVMQTKRTFYFSLDDNKWTVTLNSDQCLVERGKTVEAADCVLKTSSELFVKIWYEGYTPGLSDFMSGRIKSNDPYGLKTFLEAFGK